MTEQPRCLSSVACLEYVQATLLVQETIAAVNEPSPGKAAQASNNGWRGLGRKPGDGALGRWNLA